jgi:hypothetical protein
MCRSIIDKEKCVSIIRDRSTRYVISIRYRGKRALTYLIEKNVCPAYVTEINVYLASVTERNACHHTL